MGPVTFWGQYSYFRGEEICADASQFERNYRYCQELPDKPYGKVRPFQEYLGRSQVLKDFETSNKELQDKITKNLPDYLAFCGTLPTWKKVVFSVISFFHSLIFSPFNQEKIDALLVKKPVAMTSDEFLEKKSVDFGSVKIGKKGEVEVRILGKNSPSSVAFKIVKKVNQAILGSLFLYKDAEYRGAGEFSARLFAHLHINDSKVNDESQATLKLLVRVALESFFSRQSNEFMFVKKGEDVRPSKDCSDKEVCAAFATKRSDTQAMLAARKRCKGDDRFLLEGDSSSYASEIDTQGFPDSFFDLKSMLKEGNYMKNHRLLNIQGPFLPDLEPFSCS